MTQTYLGIPDPYGRGCQISVLAERGIEPRLLPPIDESTPRLMAWAILTDYGGEHVAARYAKRFAAAITIGLDPLRIWYLCAEDISLSLAKFAQLERELSTAIHIDTT